MDEVVQRRGYCSRLFRAFLFLFLSGGGGNERRERDERDSFSHEGQQFSFVSVDGSWEELPNWLMEKMRSVRPVVETGYENVVLIRLLIEEERACENSTQGDRHFQFRDAIHVGPLILSCGHVQGRDL